ncbi:MAG: hypothetical protein HZC29_08165, partial [Thaumarchaeota archaeon]|nr:hypothetical protein [Nitrososphaerota archaeon]
VTIIVDAVSEVYWTSPANESITQYPFTFNITAQVRDSRSAAGVSGYAVNLSSKTDGSYAFNGTYWTNATGHVMVAWSPADKGNITFKWNVGDNSTLFYLASQTLNSTTAKIWVKDLRVPTIQNTSIKPNVSLEANLNTTNITADVTDDYGVNQTWAQIYFPNGTNINLTMTLLGGKTYNLSYIPPIGGTYNVTIFARDQPPENNTNSTFGGNFSVYGKIYGDVNATPASITATGITQTVSYSFDLSINYTNTGPATAYAVNLTVYESPSGTLNYNDTFNECGTLYANQSCIWGVRVTVPAKTAPQIITLTSNGTWQNPDKTINSTIDTTEVSVSSNPVITVIDPASKKIETTVQHEKTTKLANLTIAATGNDGVQTIAVDWLRASGNFGTSCPLCDIGISTTSYGFLSAGENFTSEISITVPAGQAPGIYWAYVRTSSANAGYDDTLINITVAQNLSWTRTPASFGTILTPPNTAGTIGNISVNNTGNVKIPFQVFKSGTGGQFVTVSPTEFDLEKQTYRSISNTYNIPPGTSGTYSVTILVRNTSASPAELSTTYILNATDIGPTIGNISVTPQTFEIIENVSVNATVTDNFAVDRVWINVTRPDQTSIIKFMNVLSGSNYTTTYNSTQGGIHNLTIISNDTSGLQSISNLIQLTAAGNTTLNATPNTTSVELRGITSTAGESFALNIIIPNSGNARSNNTQLDIEVPTGWTASPNQFIYGIVFKNTSNTTNVTTITAPAGTLPGSFTVKLNVSWTNIDGSNRSNATNVNVEVISAFSWTQAPAAITKEVIQGTNGFFGNITLNNTGTQAILLNISKNGTIESYIDVNLTFPTIVTGEAIKRTITFNAPIITNLTSYTGYIITRNVTTEAGTQEKYTSLNLTVHPYFVSIIQPTQSQPYTNISYGDLVRVKVNISYGTNPVTSGMGWNVSLVNRTMTFYVSVNSSYNSTDALWDLNFTAPNLALSKGYDLNVSANYTAKNLLHFDLEGKSIVYNDTLKSSMDISVPQNTAVNETVKITANATDAGGINVTKNVTANITYPDNTSALYNLTFKLRDWDIFVYELNFTNTSLVGTYKINISACDVSGNCNSTNATFKVSLFYFNGTSRDEEKTVFTPVVTTFEFYNTTTGNILYNFTTNSTGYYSQTIENNTYDLVIKPWNENVKLYSTPITAHFIEPIKFGRINSEIIGKGSLKGMSIESVLTFEKMQITFNYSGSTGISVSNLGIYKCDNWNKYTACDSAWTRINGTVNTTKGTISKNVTVLSEAYALAEYICGNNICETSYGESNAVCPQDCQTVSVPPSVGIPTGGGEAYVAGEIGKIYSQVKDSYGNPVNSATCSLMVYYP